MGMRWAAVGGVIWVAIGACGGPQSKPAAYVGQDAPPPPASVSIGAPPPPESVGIAGTHVRGISGTLNHHDVVQAMEARAPALSTCIERGRRSQRNVSGDIEFAFKVDPEGKAVDVRAVRSDIGHAELEACLQGVLAETTFPRPAGRTLTKDLQWSTGVDAAYRDAEPLDEAVMEPVLEAHRNESRELCETRRRYAYRVTVYTNRKGRVRSSGAVVLRGGDAAREALPCLLEQVHTWKLPRSKRRWNKVSFKL